MGNSESTYGFSKVDERGRVSAFKALRECEVIPGDWVRISVKKKCVVIEKVEKP